MGFLFNGVHVSEVIFTSLSDDITEEAIVTFSYYEILKSTLNLSPEAFDATHEMARNIVRRELEKFYEK